MKNNSKWKIVGLTLIGLFIAFQFYQPAQNIDDGQDYTTDFKKIYQPQKEIGQILQASCYNCHSNNTQYEWFDYIQPGRLLVEDHIKNAKNDLNFNEWGDYSDRKQERLLRSIKTQIEENKMPPPSYTWLHPEAQLNEGQIQKIINWIEKQ